MSFGRTVIIPVGEIDLDSRDQLRSVLEATDGDVIVDLETLVARGIAHDGFVEVTCATAARSK